MTNSNFVLQDWVGTLPLKMQSVLMTATRGPDNFRYPSIKVVNRWIRSVLFKDADPANPFILDPDDPIPWENSFIDSLDSDVEYVSVHYFAHLIHALKIISYKHPDLITRTRFFHVYCELCNRVLHLPVESEQIMDDRLRDKTLGVVH